MRREQALELAERAVHAALRAGATAAEVVVDAGSEVAVGLAKNDLDQVKVDDETTLGLRVLCGQQQGFATTNQVSGLDTLAAEAVAIARATPEDPLAVLPEPQPVVDAPDADGIDRDEWDAARLVSLALEHLRRIQARDSRVTLDTGEFSASWSTRAVVSSLGVREAWRSSLLSGNVFGMAVDNGTPGSFAYNGDIVRDPARLDASLDAVFANFVDDCIGALSPQKGESFRGPVLLPPRALGGFLLDALEQALSAQQVRLGKSPFADKVGTKVASETVSLWAEGAGSGGFALAPFDREGQPRTRRPLIENGLLLGFLYDAREAAAAGIAPTGDGAGSAAAAPRVGASSLSLRPGRLAAEDLVSQVDRGVLATRFSGTSNPISGDFSGVVKGGFLLRDGERVPIHETTLAGNLWTCLEQITALSDTPTTLYGTRRWPWVRIDDLSITAA